MFVSGPVGTSVTGCRRCPDGVGDPGDGVGRDRLDARRRERRAVEPALAVDVRGDDELPLERLGGARRDRHVAPSRQLEHPERVGRGLLERLVAVRRRDAEQLELRAREREQQGDRVVVPGSQSRMIGVATRAIIVERRRERGW